MLKSQGQWRGPTWRYTRKGVSALGLDISSSPNPKFVVFVMVNAHLVQVQGTTLLQCMQKKKITERQRQRPGTFTTPYT